MQPLKDGYTPRTPERMNERDLQPVPPASSPLERQRECSDDRLPAQILPILVCSQSAPNYEIRFDYEVSALFGQRSAFFLRPANNGSRSLVSPSVYLWTLRILDLRTC